MCVSLSISHISGVYFQHMVTRRFPAPPWNSSFLQIESKLFLNSVVEVVQSSTTMAESICRALRDGALEGELAPALTIKDSMDSPFGFHAFAHLLAQLSINILAGKSQSRLVQFPCRGSHLGNWNCLASAVVLIFLSWFDFDLRGLVLLAFSRSPAYYVDLLKKRGVDVGSSDKW